MSCRKTPSADQHSHSPENQVGISSLLAFRALQCSVHFAISTCKTRCLCSHSALLAHRGRFCKRKENFSTLVGHMFPTMSPLKTMFVQRLTADLTDQNCKQDQMNPWLLWDPWRVYQLVSPFLELTQPFSLTKVNTGTSISSATCLKPLSIQLRHSPHRVSDKL